MKFKVVINTCFGGFGLSDKAWDLLIERTGKSLDELKDEYIYLGCKKDGARSCPHLIAVVEELGEAASAEDYAELEVVELEDKHGRYQIDEYDGRESVYTPDQMHWETSLNSCNEGN